MTAPTIDDVDHRPPADGAGLLRRLHPVRLWLYPSLFASAGGQLLAGLPFLALAWLVGAFLIVESLCERVHSPRDLERAERAAYRAGVARGRAFMYRHMTTPLEEFSR